MKIIKIIKIVDFLNNNKLKTFNLIFFITIIKLSINLQAGKIWDGTG